MINNLPNCWKEEKISDVVFFQEGPGVRKTQFTEKGVKLLNVGNINNNKINLSTTKIYISEEEAYGKYNHFLVEDGDLLIACSGIVVNNFHKKIAFISKKDLPLCLNTSTMRFRTLNSEKLDINFYKYFLMTNLFKNQLQRLITGSAQLNFGPSHIKKMFVPIPPLQQQEKIVKVLDLTSNLIEKQKELLEKYDLFLKSKFIEMFGDPIKNPMGFKIEKLGDVINLDAKMVHPNIPEYENLLHIGPDRIEKNTGKLLPALTAKEEMLISKKFFFTNEYILYSKIRPYLNKVAMPSFSGLCSADMYPVKPIEEKVNRAYLWKLLLSTYFIKYTETLPDRASIPKLNKKELVEFAFPLPPLELQNIFASIVEKIETIKEKENQKLKQLEDLHNSLMQKAFKGEIQ
jgi:type I restriction enzyme S subunit